MSFFASAAQSVNQAGMQVLGGFIERKVEKDNARYFKELGEAVLRTGRRKAAGTIERARVNYATSGVRLDEGSPADFVLALQEEGELAALEASFPMFEEERRSREAAKTAVLRGIVKAQLSLQSAGAGIAAGLLEREQPGGLNTASILGSGGGDPGFGAAAVAGASFPTGTTTFTPPASVIDIGQFGGIV